MLDRFFQPFEGRCNPLPLAAFRVIFYLATALHVFPSLFFFEQNFGDKAIRLLVWDRWIFHQLPTIHPFYVRALSLLLASAIVAGSLGVFPRFSAAITGVLLYVFASFNALHLHTLFLMTVWSCTWLLTLCGGGDEVLSLRTWRPTESRRRAGSRLARMLVAATLILSLFFSGIEKLRAGWLHGAGLYNLLRYPEGTILREWVSLVSWDDHVLVVRLGSWASCAFEVAGPLLLLASRGRLLYIVLYEAFFFAIFCTLAIPPLAYFTYAAGGLLLLDDGDLDRWFLAERTSPRPIKPDLVGDQSRMPAES